MCNIVILSELNNYIITDFSCDVFHSSFPQEHYLIEMRRLNISMIGGAKLDRCNQTGQCRVVSADPPQHHYIHVMVLSNDRATSRRPDLLQSKGC